MLIPHLLFLQRWPMSTLRLEIPKREKVSEKCERRTVVDFSLENYNKGEREVKEKTAFAPKKVGTCLFFSVRCLLPTIRYNMRQN